MSKQSIRKDGTDPGMEEFLAALGSAIPPRNLGAKKKTKKSDPGHEQNADAWLRGRRRATESSKTGNDDCRSGPTPPCQDPKTGPSDVECPCPECGSELRHESGCAMCPHCGYSACG